MSEIKRAVIFVGDETSGTSGGKKPLILQDILFCPVINWLSSALYVQGVDEFFVFCDEAFQEEALARMPQKGTVTVSCDTAALKEFLRTDEKVLVVPGAAVPMKTADHNDVYAAPGADMSGLLPGTEKAASAETVEGFTSIHSFADLASMQLTARSAIMQQLTSQGVNVMDRLNTYIDPRVRIGAGTLILPGTILRGETVIGENCEIGPNTMIDRCTVGDETVVNASQLNESIIGRRTKIGPFAYVRPNCTIGDDIKVGDFVEVKNSTVGNGTKISHLTYVGDSDVGERVNFGCGTVTVNYDGKKKYRCTIGDHAFIGCNSNLVAPVRVGDGAYTAAGSTITKEVEDGALGVARERQRNLPGWAEKRREKGLL